MATTSSGKKRDPLARYFKDLDACELESDESDDDDSQGEDTSNKEKQHGEHPIKEKGHSKSSDAPSVSKSNDQKHNDDGKVPVQRSDTKTEKSNKLPSAKECLSTQSVPDFLKVSQHREVNWDKHEKHLDDDDDAVVPEFKSNAVPPPATYEPQTDPGIKVVDLDGNKRKRMEDELEDQMTSTKAYKVQKSDDS